MKAPHVSNEDHFEALVLAALYQEHTRARTDEIAKLSGLTRGQAIIGLACALVDGWVRELELEGVLFWELTDVGAVFVRRVVAGTQVEA